MAVVDLPSVDGLIRYPISKLYVLELNGFINAGLCEYYIKRRRIGPWPSRGNEIGRKRTGFTNAKSLKINVQKGILVNSNMRKPPNAEQDQCKRCQSRFPSPGPGRNTVVP